jgi:4-hydroxy-2-oxoheptanedioate aldolase
MRLHLIFSMFPSAVRKKLLSGDVVICAKASYPDAEMVELMGTFGFDAMWICLEHCQIAPPAIHALIAACRLHRMDALIRVKPANYTDLIWLLEAGARGIMLPKVSTVEEVREVVSAMKFPPQGNRGYDGVHADSNFGRTAAVEYLGRANEDNFLVVQIEEPAVVEHIDAIAALPGVDVLFVGPGDLTLSLGKLGRSDDPEVTAILHQVAKSCRRHGKAAGIPCAVKDVPKYREMGYQFFNVISSYRCMLNGLLATERELASSGITLNGAAAKRSDAPLPAAVDLNGNTPPTRTHSATRPQP